MPGRISVCGRAFLCLWQRCCSCACPCKPMQALQRVVLPHLVHVLCTHSLQQTVLSRSVCLWSAYVHCQAGNCQCHTGSHWPSNHFSHLWYFLRGWVLFVLCRYCKVSCCWVCACVLLACASIWQLCKLLSAMFSDGGISKPWYCLWWSTGTGAGCSLQQPVLLLSVCWCVASLHLPQAPHGGPSVRSRVLLLCCSRGWVLFVLCAGQLASSPAAECVLVYWWPAIPGQPSALVIKLSMTSHPCSCWVGAGPVTQPHVLCTLCEMPVCAWGRQIPGLQHVCQTQCATRAIPI